MVMATSRREIKRNRKKVNIVLIFVTSLHKYNYSEGGYRNGYIAVLLTSESFILGSDMYFLALMVLLMDTARYL
jgi:hypothetical protein